MVNLQIPPTKELYDATISDLKNKLNITSLIGKMILPVIALVWAGKQRLIYLTISKVDLNNNPITCDEENLLRFGDLRLQRPPNPATDGIYTIEVTGDIGATIPVTTVFVATDSSSSPGALFITDSSFILATSPFSIQARSIDPGPDFKLEIGDVLKTSAPIVNVDSFGTVLTVDTSPTAGESLAEYRINVINDYRTQPQGGARADYRKWTESVSGVREVNPNVKQDAASEINLYIEAFFIDSTDGAGTPTAATIAAVRDAIEPEKIPLGVNQIHYLPIAATPVDVVISGLSDPGVTPTVEAAIALYLYDIRPYIGGADPISESTKGILYSSKIFDIVLDSVGSGVTFTDVVTKVNAITISKYDFVNDEIPFLNSVT